MSVKSVVSKFGGTSMGDVAAMRRSATLAVRQDSCVVVVSATSGSTNDLIQLGQTAEKGEWPQAEALIEKIRQRHQGMARELSLGDDQHDDLAGLLVEMESLARGIFLLKDCSAKAMDVLMSLGERLSSVLFTKAMMDASEKRKAIWFDVRMVLKTDDQFGRAKPRLDIVEHLCREKLARAKHENVVFITQGFIGSTDEGATTTLGRGGSDYSAAILAEGIGADILEIWTDVPGIATTDPRICQNAKPITEISFKEASELATFGAKVLHPATLLPAVRKNIPIFVGSSFDGQARGTWVRREVQAAPLIRAMALRKRQVLLTLSTPDMLNAHGFLAKIFKVFDEHNVSVDAITTSEISVSLTVDDATALNKKLLQDLERFADVQTESGLTLISLIGNSINHTSGLALKVFSAIGDINVRMICLGASKHNFCFLVEESRAKEAIRRLHDAFIKEEPA